MRAVMEGWDGNHRIWNWHAAVARVITPKAVAVPPQPTMEDVRILASNLGSYAEKLVTA